MYIIANFNFSLSNFHGVYFYVEYRNRHNWNDVIYGRYRQFYHNRKLCTKLFYPKIFLFFLITNMNYSLSLLTLWIFACISAFIIFIYGLRLPQLLFPDHLDLVKQYYYSGSKSIGHLFLDIFFISIYILIALLLCYFFKMSDNAFSKKLCIVILTTIMLTSIFAYMFRMSKPNSSFFSKWFHNVGYFAALYDTLLIVFVYMIFQFLYQSLFSQK